MIEVREAHTILLATYYIANGNAKKSWHDTLNELHRDPLFVSALCSTFVFLAFSSSGHLAEGWLVRDYHLDLAEYKARHAMHELQQQVTEMQRVAS